ncbi:MAG TPA: T9SS type A sorting domain-containing protein [Bacteroidales bacterium]|nr:T9SS type A sorting domain-containing protein [Bacteroidales bacterium]
MKTHVLFLLWLVGLSYSNGLFSQINFINNNETKIEVSTNATAKNRIIESSQSKCTDSSILYKNLRENPCIPYTNILLDSVNNSYIDIDYYNLCYGNSIEFTAISNFTSTGNPLYDQSPETTVYTWTVFNDRFEQIQTISELNMTEFQFNSDNPGIYSIVLSSQDINNCPATNIPVMQIRVPTPPLFDGTCSDKSTVCEGEEIVLKGYVNPVIQSLNTDNYFIGKCFGESGGAYSTFEFNLSTNSENTIIQSADDIESFEMNIEHSYLNDLIIELICPTEQSVIILDSDTGGNINLGFPNEADDCTPGTGVLYSWSDNATDYIYNSASEGQSAPTGMYLPAESFDQLIGCPINGTWKIIITDSYCGDDGYIFYTNINLAGDYVDFFELPNSFQDQWSGNNLSTSYWTGENIITNNFNLATTIPLSVGVEVPYTFNITDNYNCSYDTTVFVNVLEHEHDLCCPLSQPDICYITNSELYGNLIRWQIPEANYDSVCIYRETAQEYIKISTVKINAQQFIDYPGYINISPSKYKISFKNNCDEETSLSDYHQNICLKISNFSDSEFKLTWNDYFGLDYSEIQLFRGTSEENLVFLTTIPSYLNEYTDNNIPPESPFLFYKLSFDYSGSCADFDENTSIESNIATNNPNYYNVDSDYISSEADIFPNPANNSISLSFLSEKAEIKITDLNGKILLTKECYNGDLINIEELSSGIYMVNIKTEKSNLIKRLLVY